MSANKILLVDADVASRNFIARNLTDQKYEVIQAGSGREGLIFAWRDRPDLAIIDPTIEDIKGEIFAAKLKQDPRTANMPLIALSSDSNVMHIKACIDAGFSEYITKSGQAVSMLNETIARLLGISSAVEKQGGLLMVFLSAKGGTGTSSMCANIAMNIAQNHPESRVVVLDLVLPIGSIAPIVGYEGPQNIATITERQPGMTTSEFFRSELPLIETWRFHLLAGSPDPESSNHIQVGRIWDTVKALKASYDYVLVDLGRSLSKISLPLIQNADLITLILSTDSGTITLTKTLWNYLKGKGVEDASVYAILNRAVGLEGLSKADAEKVLEIPIKATMPYLSSNMAFANAYHQPFTVKFPKDTAAIVFQDCAKEMSALARKLRTV